MLDWKEKENCKEKKEERRSEGWKGGREEGIEGRECEMEENKGEQECGKGG